MHRLYSSIVVFCFILLGYSCSSIEKASNHEFSNGFYSFKENSENIPVYVDIQADSITLFPLINDSVGAFPINTISLVGIASNDKSLVLKRTSVDVDLTSILFKYRINSGNLPSEFTNDFNLALFAGPRFDNFHVVTESDPLGKSKTSVSTRASDFGFLLGVGTTTISPFSTQGKVTNEYSAMYFQTGVGAFLETNTASFGIAVGTDFLLTPDAKNWIYQTRPWLGFVVGIAL